MLYVKQATVFCTEPKTQTAVNLVFGAAVIVLSLTTRGQALRYLQSN